MGIYLGRLVIDFPKLRIQLPAVMRQDLTQILIFLQRSTITHLIPVNAYLATIVALILTNGLFDYTSIIEICFRATKQAIRDSADKKVMIK